MDLDPETMRFLDAVERHANRKLRHQHEVGLIVERGRAPEREKVFSDLIFRAKFVSHASNILKRFGVESEETSRLSAEFTQSLEKCTVLLTELIESLPATERKAWSEKFLSVSHESLQSLLALLADLTLIKNYLLDTTPM